MRFSQIADNSCLATMPLLTNSTTACDDWQSQMPVGVSSENGQPRPLTIAGYYKEFVIVSELVLRDIWVGGDYLLLWRKFGCLLEFKVANGSG